MNKAQTPVFLGTKTTTNDENATPSKKTVAKAATPKSQAPRTSLQNITNKINTNSPSTNTTGFLKTKPTPQTPTKTHSPSKTVLKTNRKIAFGSPKTPAKPAAQFSYINEEFVVDALTLSPPTSPRAPTRRAASSPSKNLFGTPAPHKPVGKLVYEPNFMRIVNQKSDYCHLRPYPDPESVINVYTARIKLLFQKELEETPKKEIFPEIAISAETKTESINETASDSMPKPKIKFEEDLPSSNAESAEDNLGDDELLSENEYFKYGVYSESNPRRLEMRQKQIDIGKNTPGYANYRRLVPKDQRRRGDPQTPNKHQVCSKRSWDGQIRKWRRLLHLFDPPELLSANGANYPRSPSAKSGQMPRTPQAPSGQSLRPMLTPQARRAPDMFEVDAVSRMHRGYGAMRTPSSPQKLDAAIGAVMVSPFSTPKRG
eukprot:TRINITY_DN2715_c0_g1_i1.p1 TRINITY_DN2715_c0_g1~~TRINITY_DN2715_c0_g1_i1.p1  ORF type:complete len:430 (+),score=134.17 TRINITY_DN2715_c0_g1_i1:2-1291(+)